jgi:pyruvate ferredoxin oxidoreductase gamma subunit
MEGKYVQAVPDFFCEKRNAAFQAYNRLSNSPLRLHSAVEAADITVIIAPDLILNTNTDIKSNTKENSLYIVNTPATPQLIKEKLSIPDNRIFTLDSAAFIQKEITNGSWPPNVPLITAIIYSIDWISIDILKKRLQQILSPLLPADRAAAYIKVVDSVTKELMKIESTDLISINRNGES